MYAIKHNTQSFRWVPDDYVPAADEAVTPTAPVFTSPDQVWDQTASSVVVSLDKTKEIMWAKIKTERDRRKLTGGYQAAGKWFHSDEFSRSQQLGLVALGANMPAGIQWKTMDGTFVEMTPTLAQQILSAAAANDIAIFTAAENHKVTMEASANPASYGFSTGWPAMYTPA